MESIQKDVSKKQITKARICKAAGLSRDTMKYWMKCGVLSTSKGKENGYNYFNCYDLNKIRSVRIHRSIGCSIEEIKRMSFFNQKETIDFFNDKIRDIDTQIRKLKIQRTALKQQAEATQYSETIEKARIFKEDPPFFVIYEVDIDNDRFIDSFINLNCQTVTYIPYEKLDVCDSGTFGIGVYKSISGLNMLWKKRSDSNFYACALKCYLGNDNKFRIEKNDANKIIEEIKAMGLSPLYVFYVPICSYSEDIKTACVAKIYVEAVKHTY